MLKGGIQNYIFDNTTKLHEVKLTSDFQKQGKYKVFGSTGAMQCAN